VVNSLAAIYYVKPEEIPPKYLHDEYFDLYSELGMNIGKLLRYSFSFDPKNDDAESEFYDQYKS
jgi:hypothetical protein